MRTVTGELGSGLNEKSPNEPVDVSIVEHNGDTTFLGSKSISECLSAQSRLSGSSSEDLI